MGFIRNWRLKAALQAALSRLPGGERINDRLQRAVGGLRNLESNVAIKVDDWYGIVELLDTVGRADVRGMDLAEIGTGWYPVLPLCFSLAGARSVLTVDLTRHLSAEMTFEAVAALEAHLARISERCGVPLEEVLSRYRRLRACQSVETLLAAAGIRYEAPQDAARLAWLDGDSLDLVYSNSVLEHIAIDALGPILTEASRVLKPNGVMVHAVACNDHYAHFDSSISFVNFLAFDEREWKRWNNRFHYQNRLRAPDFIHLAQAAGFVVVHERRAVRPGTKEALSKMRLAPQFAHYSMDDLAATTVDFVAIRSPGASDTSGGDAGVVLGFERGTAKSVCAGAADKKDRLRVP